MKCLHSYLVTLVVTKLCKYMEFRPSSIPVQFSETSLPELDLYTNQSIRGEEHLPYRAYAEVGAIGKQVASERSEQATLYLIDELRQ